MWPWEHLFFGYLLYSGVVHLRHRRPPGDTGTIVLALATQFPDLIDKPGSWVFGVLPSGTSVAHSIFVAVPVAVFALVFARRRGVPEIGISISVGYLSHLVGDISYSALLGGKPSVGVVLWPLVSAQSSGTVSVFPYVSYLFDKYVTYLLSPTGIVFVFFEILLITVGLLVWVRDSTPGTNVFEVIRKYTVGRHP